MSIIYSDKKVLMLVVFHLSVPVNKEILSYEDTKNRGITGDLKTFNTFQVYAHLRVHQFQVLHLKENRPLAHEPLACVLSCMQCDVSR